MSNLTVSDPALEATLKVTVCGKCGVDAADHKCGGAGITNPHNGKTTMNSGNVKRVHVGKQALTCTDCGGSAHFNEWSNPLRCAWRQWETARGKGMESTELNAINALDFSSWWAANPTRGHNFENKSKAEKRMAAQGNGTVAPSVVPTDDPMVPNTPAAMAAAGMIVPVEDTVAEAVQETFGGIDSGTVTVVETVPVVEAETEPVTEADDKAAKVKAAREKLRASGKLKAVRNA